MKTACGWLKCLDLWHCQINWNCVIQSVSKSRAESGTCFFVCFCQFISAFIATRRGPNKAWCMCRMWPTFETPKKKVKNRSMKKDRRQEVSSELAVMSRADFSFFTFLMSSLEAQDSPYKQNKTIQRTSSSPSWLVHSVEWLSCGLDNQGFLARTTHSCLPLIGSGVHASSYLVRTASAFYAAKAAGAWEWAATSI